LNIIVEGNGMPTSERFDLNAYALLKGFDANFIIERLQSDDWQAEVAHVNAELWARWEKNAPLELSGRADFSDLRVRYGDGLQQLQTLAADFSLALQEDNRLTLQLGDLLAQFADNHFKIGKARVQRVGSKTNADLSETNVAIDGMDLGAAQALLLQLNLLPEKPLTILKQLSPTGWLRDIQLDLPADVDLSTLQIKARLDDVALAPWSGAPGGKGLYGAMIAGVDSGTVLLDSDSLRLSFPKIFHHELGFDAATGQVRWQILEDRVLVESGALSLHSAAGQAVGYFDLDLPLLKESGDEPLMNLVINMQDSEAQFRNQFLPFTIGDELLDWLDTSIKQGNVVDAGFIFRGSLAKAANDSRTVQLYFNIDNAKLKFADGWPGISSVNGEVFIDDNIVLVEAERGEINGLLLDNATIRHGPHRSGIGSYLSIDTRTSGKLSDALDFIKSSPIRDAVGDALDNWRAAGYISGRIKAGLPLGNKAADSIDVRTVIRQGKLQHPELDLAFQRINGPLKYSSKRGLTSEGLTADLWRQPLQAVVSSRIDKVVDDTAHWLTEVDVSGSVTNESLLEWLHLPLQNYFAGKVDYTAKLSVHEGDSTLAIDSSLTELASTLPTPFGKHHGEAMPVRMEFFLSAQPLRLAVNLHDSFRGALMMHGQGHTTGSLHLLNAAEPKFLHDELRINAALEYFKLDDWLEVLDIVLPEGSEGQEFTTRVRAENISIRTADIYGASFANLTVDLENYGNAWEFDVEGSQLRGKLRYNNQQQPALQLELGNLYLPAAQKKAGEEGVADTSILDDVYPADLLAMDVSLADFRIGDEAFGRWSFVLQPIKHGVELQNFSADSKGLRIQGIDEQAARLRWRRVGQQQETEFVGQLLAGNLGPVLEAWNYDAAIESEQAQFTTDLKWYGSPLQLEMENMQGSVGIKIDDGRFLESNSTANALRLFSIFNVDTILRRLQFNFDDVFKRGLGYDKIRGSVKLGNGVLTIVDTIDVKGSSSRFQLTGMVDLANDEMNTRLVATLPITSNLPWIAALAGGPVAAVGTYIASKIFQKQMNKLTSASYRVTGSLDAPDVKLERIFDDDGSNSKSKSSKNIKTAAAANSQRASATSP
ncbi:MAG: YhdP family phospholipid transporter, partial [Pseudomonadales bacterium]